MTTCSSSFGSFIRTRREEISAQDRSFSVRQMSARIGIAPTYLSKLERDELPPPSEETARAIAKELGLDEDLLLALGGKVSSELQAIIRARPILFSQLLRDLKTMPDHAVLRLVREVRDGNW